MLGKEHTSRAWLWGSLSAALADSRDLQERDFPRQKFCFVVSQLLAADSFNEFTGQFLTFNFCNIM